ncbi:MAG: hypothetical protein EU532_04380 [Promethearchaeota archaeon]|nr:MAG: hypothetical protein EU532_04380 [Candidatus Lokiarchaeota archaeon]
MAVPSNKDHKNNFKQVKVYISKEAFRNMITHVLRFGNLALENSVEVMGICLGKSQSNGKEIFLTNAIPVSHGTQISNGFTQQDLDSFKKIEAHYINQNLQIIGWYHSHPGWGLFFSDIAIKNHRNFQNDETPYGFCIVFDHTLMGKDDNLGFEIYRLDEYLDPMNKEHHSVLFELETPKSFEYFKWIQKFVEDIQKKEPILIKEYNELLDKAPSDLQEIPRPDMEKLEVERKEVDQNIKPIISGIQEGSSQFSDIFINIYENQIGKWSREIDQGAIKGTELIRKSVTQMKEKISSGISNIEAWFNRNLNQIIEEYKGHIHQYVDKRIESQKELVRQNYYMKEEVIQNYNSNLEENFKNLTTEIDNKILNFSDKISNTTIQTSKFKDLIKESSDTLTEISEETKNTAKNIKNEIGTKSSEFEQTIWNEMKKLKTELDSVIEAYSKISNTFKKLQKIGDNFKEF